MPSDEWVFTAIAIKIAWFLSPWKQSIAALWLFYFQNRYFQNCLSISGVSSVDFKVKINDMIFLLHSWTSLSCRLPKKISGPTPVSHPF